MGTPRRSAGFTLVEVLIALAIFALASIILGATYVNILMAYDRSAKGVEEDPYIAMARQQLLTTTDFVAAEAGDEFDSPQPLVTAQGQTGPPAEHVKWTADIEPTNEADLFTVTFTCVVTPSNGGNPTTDTEVFMLLRPTWSQGTDSNTLRQQATSQILQLQGKQAQS
jgi:general secretion pathway protein I